jgi:hypothetical protein
VSYGVDHTHYFMTTFRRQDDAIPFTSVATAHSRHFDFHVPMQCTLSSSDEGILSPNLNRQRAENPAEYSPWGVGLLCWCYHGGERGLRHAEPHGMMVDVVIFEAQCVYYILSA